MISIAEEDGLIAGYKQTGVLYEQHGQELSAPAPWAWPAPWPWLAPHAPLPSRSSDRCWGIVPAPTLPWSASCAGKRVAIACIPASPGTQTHDTSLGVLYELVCCLWVPGDATRAIKTQS